MHIELRLRVPLSNILLIVLIKIILI